MDAPGSAVSNREGIANASLEDVHGYANAISMTDSRSAVASLATIAVKS